MSATVVVEAAGQVLVENMSAGSVTSSARC